MYVPANGVCGRADGVNAYSNGNSERWDSTKHYKDGLFMGFKWQCVEYARRWLWTTHGLYLQERNCAYDYHNLQHVYVPHLVSYTAGDSDTVLTAWAPKSEWKQIPCRYVHQGAPQPPKSKSLIVYPKSRGSPFGHIGVITHVDLENQLVYVADQNRYFDKWESNSYSAVFYLDNVHGKYFIRDPESECVGWIEFSHNFRAAAARQG